VSATSGAPTLTARPPAPSILKRVFSFPIAIAALLSVLGVITSRTRFDDPDMWWHLKMGQVIWNTHHVPTVDIFSSTARNLPSIPHEWLSQLVLYAFYRFAGYQGLMLWLCLFTAAILVAGYFLCSIYSGNAKVSFLGALVIWVFGTIGFAVRPQVIGYLLLLVELLLLQLGRTRNPRWFLWLPPLFALWVNCHGSFSLGLIIAATLLFSSWFNFQAGSLVATSWEPARRRMLGWSLLASVFALLINPIGIGLILYPLRTMFQLSVNAIVVTEWQPLYFGDGRAFLMLAALACVFLAVLIRRSQLYWHELLIIALATWMAGGHQRLLFPFGILIAPILSRVMSVPWMDYNRSQDRPLPNAVLIGASVLFAVCVFPGQQNLAAQVEHSSPVKAVEFLKANHIPGPMLNEWADGGYFIWAAPEYPDFIDGRGDVFDLAGVTEDFGKWTTLQAPPTGLLDKYHINFCVLPHASPMTFVMPLLPGWKSVYSDDLETIFVRTTTPTASH
jgi:hypothetical protein